MLFSLGLVLSASFPLSLPDSLTVPGSETSLINFVGPLESQNEQMTYFHWLGPQVLETFGKWLNSGMNWRGSCLLAELYTHSLASTDSENGKSQLDRPALKPERPSKVHTSTRILDGTRPVTRSFP